MDKMTLYNVAKLYYIDNKSQQEISNIIGVSRPQVSKILKEARETNIVEIRLNLPFDLSESELKMKIQDAFGISKVHIVMTEDIPIQDYDKRLDTMSAFFADYLVNNLAKYKKIGMGWGRTIYQTILKLPFNTSNTDMFFMPLVGGAGMDPCYQTNSIIDRVAEKFKSDKCFINAPAFVLNPLVRQYISEKKNLGFKSNPWEDIEIAYFSVGGNLENSESIKSAIGDNRIVELLQKRGTIGDILGNFIDVNGNQVLSEEEAISISIPLETLQSIPERVCIALGEEKSKLLIVAAKKGMFTELITDSYTAQHVLQLLKEDKTDTMIQSQQNT